MARTLRPPTAESKVSNVTNSNPNPNPNVFVPSYTTAVTERQKKLKESSRGLTSSSSLHNASNSNNGLIGGTFDKVQMTKLLIHTLHELGYENSSICLQEESGGIQVESTVVQKIFKYIRDGSFFDITLELLSKLPLKNGNLNLESLNCHTLLDQSEENVNNKNTQNHSATLDHTISTMTIQLQLFESLFEKIAGMLRRPGVLEQLDTFRQILEIMVLVNKQVFLELVFQSSDPTGAVFYLRAFLRKFIHLWDSVLLLQNDIGLNLETDFTPEQLLREMSSVLTSPLNGNCLLYTSGASQTG